MIDDDGDDDDDDDGDNDDDDDGDNDDDDDGDFHLVGNNGSLTECPARPFSGLGERVVMRRKARMMISCQSNYAPRENIYMHKKREHCKI